MFHFHFLLKTYALEYLEQGVTAETVTRPMKGEYVRLLFLITVMSLLGVNAHAFDCVSNEDHSVVVSVTSNLNIPNPHNPIFPRKFLIQLVRNGVLMKEEYAYMSVGIISNFYTGDTMHLDDGLFAGGTGSFSDRETQTGFAVICERFD